MMVDEGKYMLLWQKYAAVIHVLLKKTDNENQKLQLYRHEFEHSGNRQKANITFSFDMINGRAANMVSTTAIARDLWHVLNNNSVTKDWLKDRKVKISVGKSFELQLEKIQEDINTISAN